MKDLKTTLDYARFYLRKGLWPIPVPRKRKGPNLRRWQNLRVKEDDLELHFQDDPNVGILNGVEPNPSVDADIDCPFALRLAKDFLPPTALRSGRGKRPDSHFHYSIDGSLPKTQRFQIDGRTIAEIRSTGTQTLVAPSIHPEGDPYEWSEGPDAEPAVLDPEVLKRGVGRLAAAAALAYKWPREPSYRHDLANALAGALVYQGWSCEEVSNFVRQVATIAGDEEAERRAYTANYTVQRYLDGHPVTGAKHLALLLSPGFVRTISGWLQLGRPVVQSGGEVPDVHLTDLGNSEQFVRHWSLDVRYSAESKSWYVWNGTHWEVDRLGRAHELAKETVKRLYQAASDEQDDKERERLVKHALASESARRLSYLVDLARTAPAISVGQDAFDKDPWLLNVGNGTLDLRTGAVRPHHRADMISRCIKVPYEAQAEHPEWLGFLSRIFGEDEELIEYVRRAVGYSLTGLTSEQVVFICFGEGANGKSTFLEVIKELLGPYAQTARFESLLMRPRSGVPNDIARMRNARFITSVEPDPDRALDESLLKQLTGGDAVAARFLYQEEFEFVPTLKLWLAANHRPIIRGTDHAIWRRIRLIPFAVKIPREEWDLQLKEKLLKESPGILAWAVEGCRRWHKDGLGSCSAVEQGTEEYMHEMDELREFLEDNCVIGDGKEVSRADLYARYQWWCKQTGEEPLTARELARRLRRREPGVGDRRTGQARYWTGIGLAS